MHSVGLRATLKRDAEFDIIAFAYKLDALFDSFFQILRNAVRLRGMSQKIVAVQVRSRYPTTLGSWRGT